MRKTLTVLSAVLMVVFAAGWAHAQVRGTGFIQGTVVDADGAPLPGVQVTAQSPSLMGEQTAFTGADGSYRLALLPPGTYTVTFRLEGFATVERQNIDVGVRRTTSVDIQMQLAAVEETITVTARSPLVDIKSSKGSSEYSDEFRNSLPEPRGTGSDLMSLAPEASIPAGGGANSTPSFFGSPENSNAFQVDGVSVTDPGSGFQFPFYSPDWFEVVELTSTGAGAEYGKGMGSVFNVITKSGGNTFHGEAGYFFQNDSFIGDNTEGVLSFGEEFTPPTIDFRHDFSANVGGPVKQDEIWFFAGYQGFYEEFTEAGVRFSASENSDRFLGKLTWQLNQDNRLITSVMTDTFTLDGRPSNTRTLEEATVFEPSMNITPNITWNTVLSPDAFLEVKYSGFYGFFDLLPISDGPSTFDLGTGLLSGAYWGTYTFDRSRTNFQGNLSYFAEDFAGDHSFKFGAEYERLGTDDRSAFGLNDQGQDFIYMPYFGQPFLAYTQDPATSRNTSEIDVTTLYAQDDWTIGDRLTLNLGLRWDSWKVGFKDVSRDDEPTFNDVAPRLGVNYDLLGDGRVALHAFYGRFYEEAHGSTFDAFDPQQADLSLLLWNPASQAFDITIFTIDPLTGLGIDRDLSNVFSDQITVGIDYQFAEEWVGTVKYVRKEDDDIYGGEETGSTFAPVTVVNTDGETMTLFNQVDPGNTFTLLTNHPVNPLFREYDGVQFKVQKRMADDWALVASLLVQEANGNVQNTWDGNLGSTSAFANPNEFVNTPGELRNSRRYSFKAQASWLLPDPIRTLVGAQVNAASSARFNRTERFRGFNQGSVVVPIDTIGEHTFDDFFQLDIRAEKRFALPGTWGDAGVTFDIFNVTNENRGTNFFEREPFFGEVTSIMQPRIWRLGFRWLF